jgi:hypothetical protein
MRKGSQNASILPTRGAPAPIMVNTEHWIVSRETIADQRSALAMA